MRFDAASLKPYSGDPGAMLPFSGGPRGADPGRVSWGQVTLRTLIVTAYDVRDPVHDISGPDWIDSVWYSLTATYPPGTTMEQFREMVANFLADRFKLAIHREPRPVSGYEMTIASTGLKISSMKGSDIYSAPATISSSGAPATRTMILRKVDKDGFPVVGPDMPWAMNSDQDTIRMTFRQATMAYLAGRINSLISTQAGGGLIVVVDKTGLTDKFDFRLEVRVTAREQGISFADISRALKDKLGLQLTATKMTMDQIVIDHADRVPTPN